MSHREARECHAIGALCNINGSINAISVEYHSINITNQTRTGYKYGKNHAIINLEGVFSKTTKKNLQSFRSFFPR